MRIKIAPFLRYSTMNVGDHEQVSNMRVTYILNIPKAWLCKGFQDISTTKKHYFYWPFILQTSNLVWNPICEVLFNVINFISTQALLLTFNR